MTAKSLVAYLLMAGLATWLTGAANPPYSYTAYILAAQVVDPAEPVVPEELIAQIDGDLELIEVLLPGASSWWAFGPFVPGSLLLRLSKAGVEKWESAAFPELEALLDQYSGTVSDFRVLEYNGTGAMKILFAEPLNPQPLYPVFAALSGIEYAGQEGYIGDGDRAFLVRGTGLYIFRHGYGDCPSGCINQDLYYFTVEDNEVTQLDLEEAQALSGFSLNPSPDVVSVDTHEPVILGGGIQFPQDYTSVYGQWVRSKTRDFAEAEYAGSGEQLSIPFARLSDAGYYQATYRLRATGFTFTSPVIELKVTDEAPLDPDLVADIPDPGIRDYLLDRLHIPAPPIGKDELADLWEISLNNTWMPGPVTSLEGLQHMTSMEYFSADRNAVTDLSPVSSLAKLRSLSLGAHGRTERLDLSLEPLAGLPSLRRLELNFYSISGLDVLSSLPELTDLDLINCGISSIDPFTTLDLRRLSLSWNPVTDISLLLDFPNLQWVDLDGTPIDFSEDSPHKEVLDELRERGINVFPADSRLPQLWSTETWIPASGGRGFFWMRPGIAHNQVYHDADWLTMLGDGNPYEKVRFEVAPNPDPEPRSVRLIVHNLPHIVHQLGNAGPWRDAIPVGEDGWRRSEWLGFLLPGEDGWIWHPEHGWLQVVGESEDDLWLYDPAMECWLWTTPDFYPLLYRKDTAPSWLYYVEGGSPGERWFYDVTAGTFVHEG
jgi:hypothetical protein